jgi:hypothetical protein
VDFYETAVLMNSGRLLAVIHDCRRSVYLIGVACGITSSLPPVKSVMIVLFRDEYGWRYILHMQFFRVALAGIGLQEFQPLKSYGALCGDVSRCLESCGTLH